MPGCRGLLLQAIYSYSCGRCSGVRPCEFAIHRGYSLGAFPGYCSCQLGLLIVRTSGLPVLPWLIEVGEGLVGCVPWIYP